MDGTYEEFKRVVGSESVVGYRGLDGTYEEFKRHGPVGQLGGGNGGLDGTYEEFKHDFGRVVEVQISSFGQYL